MEAKWQHQAGCWRSEPVKHKIRRHRGGSGDKRAGSEVAILPRPSGGPLCNPPLCHPVAEGWLASTGWLASGDRLEGRGSYVCRKWLTSTSQHHKISYKHRTSGPPENLPRPVTLWRPADPQLLGIEGSFTYSRFCMVFEVGDCRE